MNSKFGKRVKALRLEACLTQKELAEKVNASKESVSGWERCLRRPSREKVEQLCEFFDVSEAFLIGIVDERNGNPVELDDEQHTANESAEAIAGLIRKLCCLSPESLNVVTSVTRALYCWDSKNNILISDDAGELIRNGVCKALQGDQENEDENDKMDMENVL